MRVAVKGDEIAVALWEAVRGEEDPAKLERDRDAEAEAT